MTERVAPAADGYECTVSGDTVNEVAPQADIEGCRVAHDLLRSVVADLGDAEVRHASKLPGWSVGRVLTHLARNAESMCPRIDAALRQARRPTHNGASRAPSGVGACRLSGP